MAGSAAQAVGHGQRQASAASVEKLCRNVVCEVSFSWCHLELSGELGSSQILWNDSAENGTGWRNVHPHPGPLPQERRFAASRS